MAAPQRWSTIFNKSKGGEWDIKSPDISNAGWKILTFMNRNYAWLSDYSFLITIRVKDIDTLASGLATITAVGSSSNTEYTTTFSVGGTEVGSISIAKIRDSDGERVASY